MKPDAATNDTYQSHMLGLEKTSGAAGFSLICPAARLGRRCGPSGPHLRLPAACLNAS